MRSIFKYLVLLTLFSSCISKNNSSEQLKSEKESKAFDFWKQEYKNVTFHRCMFLGFNRSPEIRNLLKLDRSVAQDFPFGLNQYRYIDTIVQPIIKQAKQDSTKHYDKYLKGMNQVERDELNGLPMIKYCLEFYASDDLDSISNSRVNQMNSLWQSTK